MRGHCLDVSISLWKSGPAFAPFRNMLCIESIWMTAQGFRTIGRVPSRQPNWLFSHNTLYTTRNRKPRRAAHHSAFGDPETSEWRSRKRCTSSFIVMIWISNEDL